MAQDVKSLLVERRMQQLDEELVLEHSPAQGHGVDVRAGANVDAGRADKVGNRPVELGCDERTGNGTGLRNAARS